VNVLPSILELNLDWCFFAYQTPGTRKLTWNLDGYFVGGSEQQKKQQVKTIWDLNGFRDPSFPLHLVKEKMCHLDAFGLNLDWWPHFVSPIAPPVRLSSTNPLCPPGVVVEPTTATNMEPNEFNFWGQPAPPNSP